MTTSDVAVLQIDEAPRESRVGAVEQLHIGPEQPEVIGEQEGGPARRVAGEHPDSSFACGQVVDGAAQHGAVDAGECGRHVGRFHLGRPADGVGCELTPDAVSRGSQAVGQLVLHVGLQARRSRRSRAWSRAARRSLRSCVPVPPPRRRCRTRRARAPRARPPRPAARLGVRAVRWCSIRWGAAMEQTLQ